VTWPVRRKIFFCIVIGLRRSADVARHRIERKRDERSRVDSQAF
jgi:hypothetical protein